MSSFSIRDFLNRAPRRSSAQSVQPQGGSAGTSVGTASGPSSTTPAAASTSSSLNQGIIPSTLPRFPLIPCHDTVGQDAAVEQVCEFLQDVNVGIIGIYGMGGVGKTAPMKTVHNKVLVGCDFDFIVWAIVSKEWNYKRIRNAIIRGTRGPVVVHEGVDAMDLYNFLWGKRFVLLLDDLWEHLDLIELGVPIPTNTNMCKIIFTTRSEDICQQMRIDKTINFDCLGKNDSWALFEKNVSEKALKSHSRVAHQVMKECCGLPLALIIVGKAMSSKYAPEEWEYALRILQNQPYQMPGVEKKLLSCLELSYISLEDDISRKCFLYCSLFPEDLSIKKEKLVDYWIGEGFLGKCENLEQLHNRGYHIIGVLLTACLIENGTDTKGKEAVKMHDVVRDMALWIVSDHGVKQNRFFVHPGHRLTSSEIDDRWNAAERIFVRDLAELPCWPSCPVLTTLIFYEDENLLLFESGNVQIKDKASGPSSNPDHEPYLDPCLFELMPNLTLLDLSLHVLAGLPTANVMTLSKLRYLSTAGARNWLAGVGGLLSLKIMDMSYMIHPPPNSPFLVDLEETVGQLLALRKLSLQGIWVKSLPREIGFLLKLEILDVSNTHICELPTEIQGLKELRQLKLRGTRLRSFPIGVVYLFKLEVLDLSRTKISELPQEIYMLKELRSLNLASTLITYLPKEVFNLFKLELLNLSYSNLKKLPNTTFWWNKLSLVVLNGSLVKSLSAAASLGGGDTIKVTKLEILDLSFTSILILPSSVSKLVELRHLNLEWTSICRLPEEVMSLTKLEVLNLNFTHIEKLPTSINQLQQLRELHLYKTPIQALPTQLSELSKLEFVRLSKTGIIVPDWIYQLPKLRVVRHL